MQNWLLGCVGDRTVSVHKLVGFGQVVGSVCWESMLGYDGAGNDNFAPEHGHFVF